MLKSNVSINKTKTLISVEALRILHRIFIHLNSLVSMCGTSATNAVHMATEKYAGLCVTEPERSNRYETFTGDE